MKKTKKEMIVRERCKKCGGIMGENIDGKPICSCMVWPGNIIDYGDEFNRLAKGDPDTV